MVKSNSVINGKWAVFISRFSDMNAGGQTIGSGLSLEFVIHTPGLSLTPSSHGLIWTLSRVFTVELGGETPENVRSN